MAIYEVLQEIMDTKNLSIAETARMCGLPDSTVRGIIRRRQDTVALDVAFKLSDGLNISLEQLNGLPMRLNRQIIVSDEAAKLAQDYDRLDSFAQKHIRFVTDIELERLNTPHPSV